MPPRKKRNSASPVSVTDRIGALPDSILYHVLSFLPAQAAVRTCVLARRWRYLWRYTTGLRIVGLEEEGDYMVKDLHKFVEHLLILRERTDLDTVQIKFSEFCEEDQPCVNLWVRFAVMCKVRTFTLHISDEHLYLDDLPLVSRHLRTLDLAGVALQKSFLDFASCPALENLNMSYCTIFAGKGPTHKVEMKGSYSSVEGPAAISEHLNMVEVKCNVVDEKILKVLKFLTAFNIQHAETILVSRKLEAYILGTKEKPEEENSKEGQKWRTTNALVRAWLLSSLSPQIAKQVERIKEASEIWCLLKGTYSGDGNEMLACRVQRELQELSQGERSVVDYVSQLKKLWSDLDFYDSIELECGKCVEKFSKWTERRRVRDFLNGLNSRFENRRAALYGIGKLPSLEQAISAIMSEETRLNLEATGASTQGISERRSALYAAEGANYQRIGTNTHDKKCFECGSPRHLKFACPELVGGGRGRGQDWRGRGQDWRGRGQEWR
ncbi:hypothetical protein ACQ4PT_012019 [Festuca glaucescens]